MVTRKLKNCERGATLLEISLLLSLVTAVSIGAIYTSGGLTSGSFAISQCAVACAGRHADWGNLAGPEECGPKYYSLMYSTASWGGHSASEAAKELLKATAVHCKNPS